MNAKKKWKWKNGGYEKIGGGLNAQNTPRTRPNNEKIDTGNSTLDPVWRTAGGRHTLGSVCLGLAVHNGLAWIEMLVDWVPEILFVAEKNVRILRQVPRVNKNTPCRTHPCIAIIAKKRREGGGRKTLEVSKGLWHYVNLTRSLPTLSKQERNFIANQQEK